MGYATLIRFVLWAALIAALFYGAWYMAAAIHDSIYQDGRLAERAEWQELDANRKEELGRAVRDAAQAMASDREKQVNSLIGAIDNEAKAKMDLERKLADQRAANRGLWIDAKKCRSGPDGTAKKTKDSGIDGGAAERVRLPEKVEHDLWELAADAQRVVIQYETARRLVKSCPQIEILPDAEYHNLLNEGK